MPCQGWWLPVAVCCCAAGAAIVIRFWFSSKGAQKRTDDDSEVIAEVCSVAEAHEPLEVGECDWHNLSHTALGQEVQAQDRKLQFLVERCFPCDAVDVLHALFKPGSAFSRFWQEQQKHHNIQQGAWHKQSSPLGTHAPFAYMLVACAVNLACLVCPVHLALL